LYPGIGNHDVASDHRLWRLNCEKSDRQNANVSLDTAFAEGNLPNLCAPNVPTGIALFWANPDREARYASASRGLVEPIPRTQHVTPVPAGVRELFRVIIMGTTGVRIPSRPEARR